ncbi:hypothetical protein [Kitasatospora griseola]|uniref:hypothetical protein n=1 Tax=Kitasatospora griseola TaxID=2064 RepID=UPI00382A4EEB
MAGHLPPSRPIRKPGVLRRTLDAIGGYTTYCCSDPSCDVQVRVRGMEPGEQRYYQELAADHARHGNRA